MKISEKTKEIIRECKEAGFYENYLGVEKYIPLRDMVVYLHHTEAGDKYIYCEIGGADAEVPLDDLGFDVIQSVKKFFAHKKRLEDHIEKRVQKILTLENLQS